MTEFPDGWTPVPSELPEVRLLRVQPGDVIALFIEKHITDAEFEELSARMRVSFPDNKIALFEGGVKVSILRREGDGQ